MAERFQFLSGHIRMRSGGLVRLDRGDPIPAKADPADVKRLRRMGAIGSDDVVDPAKVSASEDDVSPGEVIADDELISWVKSSNMAEVLDAADSRERAAELMEAEAEGKGRGTLIAKLNAIASGEVEPLPAYGDDDPDADGSAEADGEDDSEEVDVLNDIVDGIEDDNAGDDDGGDES